MTAASREAWERAVSASAGAELAHTWDWAQSMRAIYGYEPLPHLLQNDVPVTAFRMKTLLSGTKISSMPFMFSAPALGDGDEFDARHVAHLRQLAAAFGAYVELKSRRPFAPALIAEHGMQELRTSIYSELPLASTVDAQRSAYPKNLRANWKRAVNGLERHPEIRLRDGHSPVLIDGFHDCMLRMYRDKDRIPCHPRNLFYDLLERFGGTDHLRLFTAWDGPRVVSGIVMVRFGRNAEYAWGASAASHIKLNLPTVLIDAGIAWAIGHGCTRLGLGCTNADDRGLLDFKARWGAAQAPVYQYFIGRKVTPSNLASGHGLINRAYSLLPAWLIRPLLPVVVPQLG